MRAEKGGDTRAAARLVVEVPEGTTGGIAAMTGQKGIAIELFVIRSPEKAAGSCIHKLTNERYTRAT